MIKIGGRTSSLCAYFLIRLTKHGDLVWGRVYLFDLWSSGGKCIVLARLPLAHSKGRTMAPKILKVCTSRAETETTETELFFVAFGSIRRPSLQQR